MKLIIQKCFFVLFTLMKLIISKNLYSNNEDFIISISEKFKKNFDTNEKLLKFKKNLIKKLRNRIKENLRKNNFYTDLLEVKERTINNNYKNKNNKFKIRKIKTMKNKRKIKINSEKNPEDKKNNQTIIKNINNTKVLIKYINNTKKGKEENNFYFKGNNTNNNNTNQINNDKNNDNLFNSTITNINYTNNYLNDILRINKTLLNKKKSMRKKSSSTLDVFDWSFGDINSLKRVTKFYINLFSKCNIYINDTIYYDKDEYTSNFVDHLILHNNFESIEPRYVLSNDVQINYFIYNKKLNMFTTNFENEQHNNYSIVYEYMANNIIKMQSSKKDNSNVLDKPNLNIANNEKNVNEFLWKFYNENTNSKNLDLEVEFYFTLDKNFIPENVEFNNKMFTYKTLIDNKETYVFKWTGTLVPYEVKVFESTFPMVFENCEIMTVNFIMILIGAFFILFVVLILYLLFSSIAKDMN
jgi:predicted XRE-type DNA-binding protein